MEFRINRSWPVYKLFLTTQVSLLYAYWITENFYDASLLRRMRNRCKFSIAIMEKLHPESLNIYLYQNVPLLLLGLLGFSYIEFKLSLIRLGFSFQKHEFLYLNAQLTDSQSRTITPKDQLWVGDTEKLAVAFSHTWQIIVKFT